MALVKCAECGGQVSTKAAACPSCGAPVGVQGRTAKAYPTWGRVLLVAGVALVLVKACSTEEAAVTGAAPTSSPLPASVLPPPPAKRELPVDFERPLETTRGTLVCPSSALFERREGKGLQVAMKSRGSVFGRQVEAEKAGCEEWQEGLPVHLLPETIARGQKWQADQKCGMLDFTGGLVFSCDLRNATHERTPTPSAKAPESPTPQAPVGAAGPGLVLPASKAERELVVPSFDCGQARSPTAALVCSDASLAAMDVALESHYRSAHAMVRERLRPSAIQEFENESNKAWDLREQQCREVSCIANWYDQREQQLSDWAAKARAATPVGPSN